MRSTENAVGIGNSFIFVTLTALLLVTATSLADELSELTLYGMRLAVEVVIPSVFPFMITADLISATVDFSRLGGLSLLFERVFHIDRRLLGSVAVGSIAGFPIGARMAAELYRQGAVSREDAEAAATLSSNPSLAFVISGVGAASYGSAALGAVMYLSVLSAAGTVGVLTRKKSAEGGGCGGIGGYGGGGAEGRGVAASFDLMRSIERATLGSVGMIGVITLFSVISGLVRRLPLGELIAPAIVPLLELGGAVSYLAYSGLPRATALLMTAFALGFSGLSVHLQVRGALDGTGIGYARFLGSKILVGLLSAAYLAPFLPIFI